MSNIQRRVLFCVLLSLGVPSTAIGQGWDAMNRRFYRYHTMTNLRAERHQMQSLYPSPFLTWLGGHVDQSLLPGGLLDQYLRGLLKNATDATDSTTPGAMQAQLPPQMDKELAYNRQIIVEMLEKRGLPTTVEEIKKGWKPEDGAGTPIASPDPINGVAPVPPPESVPGVTPVRPPEPANGDASPLK